MEYARFRLALLGVIRMAKPVVREPDPEDDALL